MEQSIKAFCLFLSLAGERQTTERGEKMKMSVYSLGTSKIEYVLDCRLQ